MTMNFGSTRGSSFGTSDFDSRDSANRSKFIKERVTQVEKHFGDICDTFGSIARKNGKTRDKSDELSQQLLVYSENLDYNSTTKASINAFSRELASCNDYQDVMVKRIESRVVEPLMLFDTVIKNSREDIQAAFKAYDQEQKSKKAVEKMRERNPSDRHSLNQAETEHQKAQVNATRSAKALEEAIDKFEEVKLRDLKKVLDSYVKIQMSYHAKCMESLTKAYKSLVVLDEHADLDEFRNYLHPSTASERLHMMRSTTGGSRTSLVSQRSEVSQRSAPLQPRSSPHRSPIRSQPSKPPPSDMFSTQRSQSQPVSRPSSTQQRAPQKSTQPQKQQSMLTSLESDEETDSEEETDDELPEYGRR